MDGRRALWLAEPRLLVVADLHWGYVSSHRAQGNLLPEWGDAEIEARLACLIEDYAPSAIVWLGDSLHSLQGREAAERFAGSVSAPVLVLAGNHDLRWKRADHESLRRAGYFFHHGHKDLQIPDGDVEVIGHFHPAVSWYDGAGGNIKIPALVDSPRRLILPAFSPWSAGTPWNSRLRCAETLWAVSARRIFRMPPALRSQAPQGTS